MAGEKAAMEQRAQKWMHKSLILSIHTLGPELVAVFLEIYMSNDDYKVCRSRKMSWSIRKQSRVFAVSCLSPDTTSTLS